MSEYLSNRTLSPRDRLLIEASYEIEQLSLLMLEAIDDDPTLLGLRGLALRTKAVNSVIMSAVDDDEETSVLRLKLTGRRAPT